MELANGKIRLPMKKSIAPKVTTLNPPYLAIKMPIKSWLIAYIYINDAPNDAILCAVAFKSFCSSVKIAPGIATLCKLAKKYNIEPSTTSIIGNIGSFFIP